MLAPISTAAMKRVGLFSSDAGSKQIAYASCTITLWHLPLVSGVAAYAE